MGGGERVRPAVLVEVAAVGAELLLAERHGSGHPVAGHPAPVAPRPAAVLHPDDLRGKPRPPEGAEDAAVVAEVAAAVAGALPDGDRGEVRRAPGRRLPLADRAVRDGRGAGPAPAPWMARRPLRS